MSQRRIDHRMSERLICPYCGHVYDSGVDADLSGDNGEMDCERCGGTFVYIRMTFHYYSTERSEKNETSG